MLACSLPFLLSPSLLFLFTPLSIEARTRSHASRSFPVVASYIRTFHICRHVTTPRRAKESIRARAGVGDFPAMERERATRGTNRGSPRGIPRKTRSHQDSWMLALCCTDLTYWPLQLPCTINRDPARGAWIFEKKERKKEREEKKGREARRYMNDEDEDGEKRREMWLVTLLQASRSSLSPVLRVVFVAGLSRFFSLLCPSSFSFCVALPFASISLGKADGR